MTTVLSDVSPDQDSSLVSWPVEASTQNENNLSVDSTDPLESSLAIETEQPSLDEWNAKPRRKNKVTKRVTIKEPVAQERQVM
jgi:hypothetical protein